LNIEWRLSDVAPDFLADHIDCAIHVGFEPDPNTVAILLAEVPRIMVASPELLARFPEIQNIEDLQSFPWLELSTYYRHEIHLKNQLTQQTQRVPIQSRLSTDSLFVLKNAALQGVGVALISSWLAADALADGTLVNILPEWQAAPLPVYLVYPWARYYPARLRQFLSLMREVMPTISGMQQLK
jgi:DNA-binding transcriptional LysR family regulator